MISGRTELIWIVGDPIAQAVAPGLINPALEKQGRDAVLIPAHVRPPDVAGWVAGVRASQNVRGAIVTMPHKAAVAKLCDSLDTEATLVSACNAIRRESDGGISGANFDGEGFVAGLRRAGHEVRGRRVFLAGAGGAGTAIAFALARHGAASLVIHNRTRAAAESLAAMVRTAEPAFPVDVGDASARGCDLVVNATSLGMQPGDPPPLDTETLERGAIVSDIVTRPDGTRLLDEAAARGCVAHPGRPMLEAQLELMLAFFFPRPT